MFCEVLFAGLGGYVRKKWSKNSWYREKTWNAFVSETTILSRKLATKKWKTKWASLSSYNMWRFSESLCNRISTWCAKFENMMHVRAVWKCWILVRKPSKCLNSFAELIYFLETFSILCFVEMLCSESGLMNSLDHNIMAPQNFDPKFHIHKKVLKICWLKLISPVLQINL